MKASIIGIGYVGLPLSIRLVELGFEVTSIDKNKSKITALRKGFLPFAEDEPQLPQRFKETFKKIKFSESFADIKQAETIFICVDTPIKTTIPNYASLKSATENLSKFLKKGAIVIVESTVAPGTTRNLVIPTIEKYSKLKLNRDFFVATVPERIRPNHIFEQLTTLSRVIGVSDKKIESKLKDIYSKITSGDIDFTNLTTAETVKTVENTYRDVQIAFANEIAIACEELGVNVWQVRDLVNKSPFHHMHEPGTGVGGHCIPKDPWLLASSVKKRQMRLIETARSINDNMPAHIFALVKEALKEKKIKIANANLAILGYSYVENSDDIRNSPTEKLIQILKKEKIKFEVYDPFVEAYSQSSIEKVAKGADVLIIMVKHKVFTRFSISRLSRLMRNKIIIDGRNAVNENEAKRYGFIYEGVGNVRK